jgi:predicted acyl esterase
MITKPLNVSVMCLALICAVSVARASSGSIQTTQPAGSQAAQEPGPAPGAAYIRENYSKYEYRIPMRDGVKLFTSVYVPKDVIAEGKTYPIMMARTPSVGRMAWINIARRWGHPNTSLVRSSSSLIRMSAADS